MIDREGETRKEWNDNAALPRCSLTMGTNDTVYEGIANPVLDFHLVHDRTMDVISMRVAQRRRHNTHEVMKNWFSMYTKCSDIWIAFRYAF